MVKVSKREIGEVSSNSGRNRYTPFSTNNNGKGMNIYLCYPSMD